ncbi:MAG TPA: hypothetical protein PLK12_16450, partial [Prolixibacteraceae bacterium]|nr:hypothetical protein [Prolixibacteraceae bacterium]
MRRYLFIAMLLSFSSILDGEEPSESVKPFRFSGQSKVYGQYSNREGYGQLAPANYFRWSVSSNVSLYEIPFQIHFLLSTEQQEFQQSLNTFTFRFDYATFIKSEASKRIPFLTSFKTLELGTTRPQYT